MKLLFAAAALAAVWIAVLVIYVAAMHAKRVKAEQGLTLFWKVHLYAIAIAGLVLDVVFNFTFGLMFAELPEEEWLFSSRVQRHYSTSDGWRRDLAVFWARQLNQMDPGHIRETGRYR